MSITVSTESILGFAGLTMELAQIAGIESALLATVLAAVCVGHNTWQIWSGKSRSTGA